MHLTFERRPGDDTYAYATHRRDQWRIPLRALLNAVVVGAYDEVGGSIVIFEDNRLHIPTGLMETRCRDCHEYCGRTCDNSKLLK